ncbi:MAG: Na+/H+ antiporter NhaC [Tissierellia bacterium]|nr:Na+/H+ antiporter NhaC [Tissierellia bacterium]
MKKDRRISLGLSLIPILFLMITLILNIKFGNEESIIPLIGTCIVAAIIAVSKGYTWEELEEGIISSITITLQSFLILMIIGIIIGTWISGGIVPTIIYYGLHILSPKFFLVASAVLCSIVSLSTGSSWTTVGTIGVALLGIGHGLGVPAHITAGSIISGAYFGDKMSPLSETTNMAAAVTGVDLYEHIKHMFFTTFPALLISLVIFFFVGRGYGGNAMDQSQVLMIEEVIKENFVITPWLFLAPLIVILLVVKKVPAIPALMCGAFMGFVCSYFIQKADPISILNSAQYGFEADTGNELVDQLLSKGGLDGMMYTISLIILAMSIGGILETSGMLQTIVDSLLKLVKGTGSLIASAVASSILVNIVTGDQSLAIILPGRMFAKTFEEYNLKAKNLSRVCEDGGTVTSPLVPWNVCGAFMASTLGVPTIMYLPFCFFNLISPLISIIWGFTGITIEKINNKDEMKGRGK